MKIDALAASQGARSPAPTGFFGGRKALAAPAGPALPAGAAQSARGRARRLRHQVIGAAIVLPVLAFVVWALASNARLFLITLLNGLTLAALYFLVASGFTLIFGLMRNVNLAHGSLYLLGAYAGWMVGDATGSWLLAVAAGFLSAAALGLFLQLAVFRYMQGEDLRQTMVTIGISIVLADLMLWTFGGEIYTFDPPGWMYGATRLPLVNAYSTFRLLLLLASVVIGVLLWLFLNRTRVGMMIRAGVDDRTMLSAAGVNVQLVFAVTFAIGAGMAGFAGVVGGTALSIAPGEDTRYLLASLIVVIVGGMGSVPGAAVGALLIGTTEQFGITYAPTYGIVFSFVIMVLTLAMRPQGIMGKAR
jgi:branched-chain amino acid transport system permease protein